MRLKTQSALLACVLSTGFCTSSFAQITGKVLIDGKAPARQQVNMAAVPQCAALHANPVLEESVVVGNNGELANVVVSLKEDGDSLKGKGEMPKEPVVLDQQGCQYHPHVVGMMIGQELVVKNADPFLHNVHGLPLDNKGFNFAQPNVDRAGKKLNKEITVPERFSIKCDVHPWMLAHVSAFDHPFFAVTDAKGDYSIPTKGLPDGKYTLVFWQETFNEQEGPEITVTGGKAKVEPFKMKQEQAAAPGIIDKVLGTALLSKTDKSAECDCCADEKTASTKKVDAKEKSVAKAN